MHEQGPVHYAGQVGGLVIEIYPLQDDRTPVDSSTRLGFAAEDLAEVLQKLQAIGTEIVTPPRETVWGLQAVVRDPDGRAVELSQK